MTPPHPVEEVVTAHEASSEAAASITPASLEDERRRLAATWAEPRGFIGWFRQVDHKSIGRRMLVTAFVWFALAGILAKVDNKLIISGHTDATPYRTRAGYNNWNLSGDRALRARNVMVDAGLPSASVLQVAAQADVMPLRPEEPEDGANRRIELLLLTTRAEALYRELFGDAQAQVHYSPKGSDYVAPARPEEQRL